MIRRAKKHDIDRLSALLKQVLEIHSSGRPDIFKHGTQKYSEKELAKLIDDDMRPVFVYADSNDRAVGYAFCIIEDNPETNNLYKRKTLYIDDICVDENERGKHIGKSIYEYIRSYAQGIGCVSITLNVWELNSPAMQFYKSMGMSPLKTVMEDIL